MTDSTSPESERIAEPSPDVELVIAAPTRDLGDGFVVRRALPSAQRRMVGPFIFVDQMGPVTFAENQALDVRPHPHIGLATLTYLFEGEIMHRDSLGTAQPIRPGEVNWMTAGSGIVHSERTPTEQRVSGSRAFGIQCWLALPKQHEEVAPSFVHYEAGQLPTLEDAKLQLRLIVGDMAGASSPVHTFSKTLYAIAAMHKGTTLQIPNTYEERAFYVVEGAVAVSHHSYGSGELVVLRHGKDVVIRASEACRLLILGGEPMDGPRHIYWNFVSSSKTRLEQAKADWKAGHFVSVPGDAEFIPLPADPPKPIYYP